MTKVIYKNGHYEVYRNGKFQCSADTRHEAEQDKEEAEAEKKGWGVKSPFHEIKNGRYKNDYWNMVER